MFFSIIMSLIFIISLSFQNMVVFGDDTKGQNLPLDGLTINEFKIVDKDHGNVEIDISYAMENDPTAFSNAMCEDQSNSFVKLSLDFTYNNSNPIKEGDTLTIPATYGGSQPPFAELPLLDGSGNVLGTWKFTGTSFDIKFGGDFINNNTIQTLNATLSTGWIKNVVSAQPKTFNKGERVVKQGIIGNKPFTIAYEKYYVVAAPVGETDERIIKYGSTATDSQITWVYVMDNDYIRKNVPGSGVKDFYLPHFLENNGEYNPDSYAGIYIEDTIAEARSNRVAVMLGLQETPQLKKGYKKEVADTIMSVAGNILAGALRNKETLDWLEKLFGKIKQKIYSESISKQGTTTSINEKMEAMIPAGKIASLSTGEMVGILAKGFENDDEFKTSAISGKINLDMKAIKREEKNYVEMPTYYSFNDKTGKCRKYEVLMTNFRRINKEVELIVNEFVKNEK